MTSNKVPMEKNEGLINPMMSEKRTRSPKRKNSYDFKIFFMHISPKAKIFFLRKIPAEYCVAINLIEPGT
jgi:hypothetical protein